jgi:ligand-binding sensor domain-containing protein
MLHKLYIGTVFLLLILNFNASAGIFEMGDWVTYGDSRSVYACDKGRNYIYFATSAGILEWDFYKFKWDDPLTVAYLPAEYAFFDTVYSVAYDENTSYLWCGTTKGLFSYSTMGYTWDHHLLALGDPNALSIGITADNIWVEGGIEPGTGVRMLFKGDPGYGAFSTATPAELEAAGYVRWLGERAPLPEEFPVYFVNQGGMIFDTRGVLSDNRFRQYPTTCILNDGRGYSWLGFAGYGIGMADNQTRRMDLYVAGPESSAVNSFTIEEDGIWTVGKELAHWRRDQNLWEHFRARENTGFYSGRTSDIVVREDYIYIASDLGLTILDRKTNLFHTLSQLDGLSDSYVTVFAEEDQGLWIGTAEGINYLDFRDNLVRAIKDPKIKDQYILYITPDDPFVWVGTEYGLFLYDHLTQEWTYVRGSAEMRDSEVNCIQVEKDEVWLARTLGIEVFNKLTGEWKFFLANYYNNWEALYILPADTLVWIGTDGGLVKFEPALNRWVTYTTEDGLPSNTINYIIPEGDYLYLATPNGLCRFYWNDPYRLD